MSAHEISPAIGLVEDPLDRRTSNRVSYATTLGVAVFDGQAIPPAGRFVQVAGSDFSHTGISFTTSQWPVSDQLILQLGSLGKTVYAAVHIVGCVAQRRSQDNSVRFEVRCEIDRWL